LASSALFPSLEASSTSLKVMPFFFIWGTERAHFSLAEPKATDPSSTLTCHFSASSLGAYFLRSSLNWRMSLASLAWMASAGSFSSSMSLSTLLMKRTGRVYS